jgi:hypothetical protein
MELITWEETDGQNGLDSGLERKIAMEYVE